MSQDSRAGVAAGSWARPLDGRETGEIMDARSAFEGLLDHRETIFRICLGFAGDYSEAEDLAQETYLKAVSGLGGLRDPAKARDWLLRIARNVCRDAKRKRRLRSFLLLRWARPRPEAATPGPAAPEADDPRLQVFKRAVGALPVKLREPFVLREYGGLSYAELAAALGLKEGTVMSRLHRARAVLARTVLEKAHE